MQEEELLKYAASVEAYSEHPIAKGVVSSVKETFSAEDFKAIPGKKRADSNQNHYSGYP